MCELLILLSVSFSQVTGVPTVLGIKNGKLVGEFSGLVETEQLREFVERLLK